MFDIAWSELGVIAVVALVVIGPKDLPKVLRTLGQWTTKARSMAREFQSGVDDMVREAELDELRKAAKDVSNFSIENEIKKTVDPDGDLQKAMNMPADIAADFKGDISGPASEAEPAAAAAEAAPVIEAPKTEPKP